MDRAAIATVHRIERNRVSALDCALDHALGKPLEVPLARIRSALHVEYYPARGVLVTAQEQLIRDQLERIERSRLAPREHLRGGALDLDNRIGAVLALADRERPISSRSITPFTYSPISPAFHPPSRPTARPIAPAPVARIRVADCGPARAPRSPRSFARRAPAHGLRLPRTSRRDRDPIAAAASFARLAATATAVALRALRRLAIARYCDDRRTSREPIDLTGGELLHEQLVGCEAKERARLLERGLPVLGDELVRFLLGVVHGSLLYERSDQRAVGVRWRPIQS